MSVPDVNKHVPARLCSMALPVDGAAANAKTNAAGRMPPSDRPVKEAWNKARLRREWWLLSSLQEALPPLEMRGVSGRADSGLRAHVCVGERVTANASPQRLLERAWPMAQAEGGEGRRE
ncbi:hypothetical protein ERJ75_001165500 [Trypanosoma vivax]|nr:hypothetical protein TRVL_01994 [Trypanosoma vivax]KAH8609806.1 hypothetical protein ERJ75_001165500 [Trypanosoma vivax]